MELDYLNIALGAGAALILFSYWIYKGFQAKNQEHKIEDLLKANASLQTALDIEKETMQRMRDEMGNQFKALSQEALAQSSESFLKLAQERLKNAQSDAAHDLNKRQTAIDEMVKPVKEHLKKLEDALGQVQGTDKSLIEQIQFLQKTTARIDGALRNPRHQGEWGEKVLEGLLEHSGLIKGVHFETQKQLEVEGQKLRPDAIISLGDGLKIIVDAKAPLHDFSRDLDDAEDEQSYKNASLNLAKQIRSHIQDLRKKSYSDGIENVDFTVLFLPSEHVFSAAIHADPQLIDYAAESKIIVVSPTLMISLLKVVSFSWRQVELAENATKISEAAVELHKRLNTFTDHLSRVGRGLSQAVQGYDDAIGSFEARVLPQVKQLESYNPTNQSSIDEKTQKIDKTPRNVTVLASKEENVDNAALENKHNEAK